MFLQIATIVLEATIALLAIISIWWFTRRPKKTPPGPWGIPLLGYMPFMDGNPGEIFGNLGKKYGPIVSYDMGMAYTVIINDYHLLRKAFHDMGDVFSGRSHGFGDMILDSADSFVCSEGKKWSEVRRFATATLREFGLGKASIEPKILDEIAEYVAEIKSKNSEPFEMSHLLGISMSNVTAIIEFNQRFSYSDPKMLKSRQLMADYFASPWAFLVGSMYPKLINTFVWRMLPTIPIMRKCVEHQTAIVQEIYENHKKEHYPGKQDDYIDCALTEREQRIKKNEHPDFFDDKTIMADLRILTLGGSDSTVVLLQWAYIYLIVHQDMQKRIRDEIDNVVGRSRQPSMGDRLNMSYTEAFITEILRKCSSPFLDGHATTQDVEFEGYFIPKRTNVYGNAWAIHHDEKLFPDPYTFRPERFLDENNKVIKTDRILTFGIGKRNCIGESLARMTMFLYLTSILQNFELLVPENEVVSTQAITHIGYAPQPFKMRAVERKD